MLSGSDPYDSTTVSSSSYEPVTLSNEPKVKPGLTVGIPAEYHCPGMSQEILDIWSDVADLLEKEGAIVKQVNSYFP